MADIFDKHKSELTAFFADFPHLVAAVALRFFDESWTNKGFKNNGLNLWKSVKEKKTIKSRPLVKTGNLRQGMDYEIEGSDAVIFNDETYSIYHNEGGEKEGRPPQRQFMGDSTELEQQIEDMILNHLNSIS
jgi:phage gpG-like protein